MGFGNLSLFSPFSPRFWRHTFMGYGIWDMEYIISLKLLKETWEGQTQKIIFYYCNDPLRKYRKTPKEIRRS